MSRVYYFIRAEPWDHQPPEDLRARLFDALSVRFAPELRDHWDSIWFTSIPSERWSKTVNERMHARISEILDSAAPEWRSEFRIVPYEDA